MYEQLAKALRRPRRTTGVYRGKWLWSRDRQSIAHGPKQVISVNNTVLEHSHAHWNTAMLTVNKLSVDAVVELSMGCKA